MATKVLLVGINYIGTVNQLNGCVNDIKNVKAKLKTDLGLRDSDFVTISDGIPGAITPTRAHILAQIKKLVADAKPGDEILFHYSGHGTYQTDSKFDADYEADGYDEAICPKTGGNISDDLLSQIVMQNKVGVKLGAILDCCHSGTGFDLPNNTTRSLARSQYGIVSMLSGCLDEQTSADAYISGKYQGALTACLLQVVQEMGGFRKFLNEFWSNSATKMEALKTKIRAKLDEGEYEQRCALSWGGVLPPVITAFNRVQSEHKYPLRRTPARQAHADQYEKEKEVHGSLEQVPHKAKRAGAHA